MRRGCRTVWSAACALVCGSSRRRSDAGLRQPGWWTGSGVVGEVRVSLGAQVCRVALTPRERGLGVRGGERQPTSDVDAPREWAAPVRSAFELADVLGAHEVVILGLAADGDS